MSRLSGLMMWFAALMILTGCEKPIPDTTSPPAMGQEADRLEEAPKPGAAAPTLQITCRRGGFTGGGPTRIVELSDGAFLRDLWGQARPKFKQAMMQQVGPDASSINIEFSVDDQALKLISWHRHYEQGGRTYVGSTGVRALKEGETIAAALAADEAWYRDFRDGFDLLLERAVAKGEATSALQECIAPR